MEFDRLAELRPTYLCRLKERADLLDAFLVSGAEADRAGWGGTLRLVHSMASSAAIYGYAELSMAARDAEATLSEQTEGCAARVKALQRVLNCALGVLAAQFPGEPRSRFPGK
jgi:HPt (histidine-containing phosphotransfer) domain-containing protein